MRIVLVNMPWAPIDTPSLALGVLGNATRTSVPDAEVQVLHAHLDYVDWITERREFGLYDYNYFALDTYFKGVGDWIFSSALHRDPDWRNAEFAAHLPNATDEELAFNRDLHRLAPEFVAETARRIVEAGPDVVGFTSMYQQNVAALAAAAEIKRLDPTIRTVFGGANCDGDQGAALHRNFEFVDLVLRGEGDVSFPELMLALRDGTDLTAVPGLCWRDAGGRSVANPMSPHPLPPGRIVGPDYDGYYERLEESVARTWVEPKLLVEGSRGCWWGEKHHCTFCGLNGSSMQFRSKDPQAFLAEIIDLVERYQVLDMYVVDNILDMGYLTSLLPALAATGYDLRLQYETKSNLRRGQLRVLLDAGLVKVQPGVESLSTRVLRIMDKGVTGCQNVRLLRDSATVGMGLTWNFLYGFPGETDADYEGILDQLPALAHLQPADASTRLAVERFSPYFNRPELGFADLAPAAHYRIIYDLPETELFDLAYLFTAPPCGIGPELADRIDAAIVRWQQGRLDNELSHCDTGDRIVLVNRRPYFAWSVLELIDPVEIAAFRLLDQPHGVAALAGKITAQRVRSDPVRPEEVSRLLDRWRALGLVFGDGGHYVHVVPEDANQALLRVDPALIGQAAAPGGPEPAAERPGEPVPRQVVPAG